MGCIKEIEAKGILDAPITISVPVEWTEEQIEEFRLAFERRAADPELVERYMDAVASILTFGNTVMVL